MKKSAAAKAAHTGRASSKSAQAAFVPAVTTARAGGRGGCHQSSLKSLYRVELWFLRGSGLLIQPQWSNNSVGLHSPAASARPRCAPARPDLSPGSSAGGQRSCPRHHSLPLRPLRTVPISLEFQLKTQTKLFLRGRYILTRGGFSQGRRSDGAPGSSRGPCGDHPPPGFHAAPAPTLAFRPQTLASHRRAQGSRRD